MWKSGSSRRRGSGSGDFSGLSVATTLASSAPSVVTMATTSTSATGSTSSSSPAKTAATPTRNFSSYPATAPATPARTPGSRRSPGGGGFGAFWSCFGSPDGDDEPEERSPGQNAQFGSLEGSNSGGTMGSQKRMSYKGLYGSSNKSLAEKEPGSTIFTGAQIRKATKNFSESMKIGQGGSGIVYKGLLDDGTLIAVKRAKKNLKDNRLSREFQNEIETLKGISHLNLVKLYGCLEMDGEKLIVVEYVSNGTLREHIDCVSGEPLSFSLRLDIAIDVAHAITYLHTYSDQPVIHRDIKSSNILLTENFRAKVADFGFAKLVPPNSTATHVSTQVKGTAGYLDPEYLRTYHLTEKSDVYSFGILLVELVTGRRPIETKRPISERVTAKWAFEKYEAGAAGQTLDRRLKLTDSINSAIERIYEIAKECVNTTRNSRPSMKRCGEVLWSIRKDYREFT